MSYRTLPARVAFHRTAWVALGPDWPHAAGMLSTPALDDLGNAADEWWAELTDVQREAVRLTWGEIEPLPSGPERGDALCALVAKKIRHLTDTDPRSIASIAASAWPPDPEISAEDAETHREQMRRKLNRARAGRRTSTRDGDQPVWPSAETLAGIAEAFGVHPFALLVPVMDD